MFFGSWHCHRAELFKCSVDLLCILNCMAFTIYGSQSSLVFTFSESFLLHLHLWDQFCVAQERYRGHSPECCSLMRDRDSSPTHMTSGLDCSPAVIVGRGKGGHLCPAHITIWQRSNGDSSPILTTSGLSSLSLPQKGHLYCA